MSSASHSHHHILPLRVYLTIGAILLVFTAITVWVAQHDYGPANLLVAMIIAATKAMLVALYFMHLKYDNRLYLAIFTFAILFLAVFIILTMFDTMRRAEINPVRDGQINSKAVIYQADSLGAKPPNGVTDSTAKAQDSTATTAPQGGH